MAEDIRASISALVRRVYDPDKGLLTYRPVPEPTQSGDFIPCAYHLDGEGDDAYHAADLVCAARGLAMCGDSHTGVDCACRFVDLWESDLAWYVGGGWKMCVRCDGRGFEQPSQRFGMSQNVLICTRCFGVGYTET